MVKFIISFVFFTLKTNCCRGSDLSGNTTFGNNNNIKDFSIDFINKNLDIIKYKITNKLARVAFFKKKYFELYKDKAKSINDYIEFDIPYIINIAISFDCGQKYENIRYKLNGLRDDHLWVEPMTKDGYFREIERTEGYELVESSRYEEKLQEIKQNDEWFKKLRGGKIFRIGNNL